MKKILSLLIILTTAIACFGCGEKNTVQIKDTQEILEKTWSQFTDQERFEVIGGDYEHQKNNKPGKFGLENKDALEMLLLVKGNSQSMLDDASGLIHAMNANAFTGAAFHLMDKNNTDDFIVEMEESIMKNHWLCGFPEVAKIWKMNDDYVVMTFGIRMNVSNFEKHLTAVYPTAELVFDELIG